MHGNEDVKLLVEDNAHFYMRVGDEDVLDTDTNQFSIYQRTSEPIRSKLFAAEADAALGGGAYGAAAHASEDSAMADPAQGDLDDAMQVDPQAESKGSS